MRIWLLSIIIIIIIDIFFSRKVFTSALQDKEEWFAVDKLSLSVHSNRMYRWKFHRSFILNIYYHHSLFYKVMNIYFKQKREVQEA